MKFTGIRAVTFDVGGTLITPWPSVGDIYAEVAKQHGYANVSPEALNKQFRLAWKRKEGFTHRREQWQALVNETFAGSLTTPPSDEFFADLYDYFGRAGAWRVFDDVLPALKELRGHGFKLAVLSNWDERLRPLLSELGLIGFFDGFAISMEVGQPKPGKAIFEFAASQLGVPVNAILHVGDTMEEDMNGARVAGFSALLIDRKAGAAGGNGVIRSLLQVLPVLEKRL